MLIDKFKSLESVDSITRLECKIFKLDRDYFIQKGIALATELSHSKQKTLNNL